MESSLTKLQIRDEKHHKEGRGTNGTNGVDDTTGVSTGVSGTSGVDATNGHHHAQPGTQTV